MRLMFSRANIKKVAIFISAAGATGLGTLQFLPLWHERRRAKEALHTRELSTQELKAFKGKLPTREEQLKSLQQSEFDVLVIGGGATGTGVALDAISRGLSCALVEKYDYASGTSSRSTKLIHGGVRYLQKAIFNLDIEQYRMVREALTERANLIEIAPHLAKPIPIMLPLYKWWQLPYYWVGIKMYDLVSGKRLLKASYYLNKARALEQFPMLKQDKLKGAIVYFDGQQEDARMNLSLALTAIRMGAAALNYTEVVRLLHETNENNKTDGKVCGAVVRDRITGKEFSVRAKCIVNATGPYTDSIRVMDLGEEKTRRLCIPSVGVHVVLPGYYSPVSMGLLDPATTDGRVIFFLPWQNSTIAGTTDHPCEITDDPTPTEGDIQFILNEIRHYLTPEIKVRRGDVLSAWAGLRPLVMDPSKTDTQSIARNHIIEVSTNGLITIAGGKWTTYRHMAQETVDKAIEVHNLKANQPCCTEGLRLEGGHKYSPNIFIQLSQDYGIESVVAEHLVQTYGDRATEVAQLCKLSGKRWPIMGERLHPHYPYIEAEVLYACREYAQSAVDVIARRTRLAFLNVNAAEEVLPKVVQIMAKELNWSRQKQQQELEEAKAFLTRQMSLGLKDSACNVPINFSNDETNFLVKRFNALDEDKKGFITVNDIKKLLKQQGDHLSDEQVRDILNEVDLNRNGEIDLTEFLQFMSAHKTGAVGSSRFEYVLRQDK